MQRATARIECADAIEFLRGLPSDSVDLVFTSPPYPNARTYGRALDLNTVDWVEWMRPIVREACRVTRGLAFFNVSDQVADCVYGGGPELLFADAKRIDELATVRPYVWVKANSRYEAPHNGQPGSGGKHFHRNDYEPVLGFAEWEKLPPPWSDNTAYGHSPVWDAGGKMTQRTKNGSRMNTGRMATMGAAGQPDVVNPGNVIRVPVGGGKLGHPLAHESVAPMPLGLAERFVCWFCPPMGTTCDPFTGSGTTADACIVHGRNFIGCDIDRDQVDLAMRRLETVTPSMFAGVA